MLAPFRSAVCALPALTLALAACGPSPDAAKGTAETVKSDTPVTLATPAVPAVPQTPPTPQFTANASSGAKVPDPAWFSPLLLPGASVTKKGRSPADDEGRFTSQILFALPSGATMTDCTEPLAEALAKIVPEVKREEKDGRITLSGDTPEYKVLFICGDANGTLSAYTSYRWTVTPPAP